VHVSFSVLYIKTCPDTLVKEELRPPVMRMHPSFKPMATEYDCSDRFLGTSFLDQLSL
jgi:hypothetical protein